MKLIKRSKIREVERMQQFWNETYDQERAFYGVEGVSLDHCNFDGPADGESAFKEAKDIAINYCFFNLRYPFWHDQHLKIENSNLTELCRAALWYSQDIEINNTKLHGIKALRECSNAHIENSDIISPEFGWNCHNVSMHNGKAQSEYFMMNSERLKFSKLEFKGKYSFQYIHDAVFEDCKFDTKDAFWHGKNIVVRNSIVKGEYLAWYSEDITFEHCTIIGTQPLCYVKNLKMIDCKMVDTDLAFERSTVEATLLDPIVSIKNPLEGTITVPYVQDEIVMDIEEAKGVVIQTNPQVQTNDELETVQEETSGQEEVKE